MIPRTNMGGGRAAATLERVQCSEASRACAPVEGVLCVGQQMCEMWSKCAKYRGA